MTLNLFPNLSQDRVFLRGDLPAKEDVTIWVYNLMGNGVWQKELEDVWNCVKFGFEGLGE